MPRSDRNKLIVASENLVVGHAVELLLQGEGYDTTLMEGPPANGSVESFVGSRLLLFTPASSASFRGSVLAAIRSIPALAGIPVLDLAPYPGAAEDEGEGQGTWPHRIDDVRSKIEAFLQAHPDDGTLNAAIPLENGCPRPPRRSMRDSPLESKDPTDGPAWGKPE